MTQAAITPLRCPWPPIGLRLNVTRADDALTGDLALVVTADYWEPSETWARQVQIQSVDVVPAAELERAVDLDALLAGYVRALGADARARARQRTDLYWARLSDRRRAELCALATVCALPRYLATLGGP